ncbi:MAG: ribonuclease J [Polyangiaceae bacterium]
MSSSPAVLRVVPLGGLGEIGMNCLALECGGDILVIDCGVTFPTSDLGIDLYHPRFDWLLERRDRVRGVVLTHGHEDHIGALPYLLDALDVPVFGPRHALELARMRLAEHQFDVGRVPLHATRVRERFTLGCFEIEALRVTHSICDATALAIRTPVGLVVHTGDFKLDPHPTDTEVTDEGRLEELGDEGVRLLFSDSTNVDSRATSLSERVVGEALGRAVAAAEGRVIVGMFASNVQRLALLGRIARAAGRSIALLGRSAVQHVRVASDLGYLDWPGDLVVSPEIAAELPRREILGIATGTQGEPNAALARLASGGHPRLKLERGDTVVFSSRVIPGNDRAVIDLMGKLLRAGIRVVGRANDPLLHASGHAHRDELLRMIELTRPRAFVPVHGTRHHLERHAELARDAGVGDVLVIENGDIAALGADSPLTTEGTFAAGKVATFGGDPLPDEVIHDRVTIGRSGLAVVSLNVDERGTLVGSASVAARGVVGPIDRDVLRMAERAVARVVAELGDTDRRIDPAIAEAARLAVRRTIEAETGQRPIVEPIVHRMPRSGG